MSHKRANGSLVFGVRHASAELFRFAMDYPGHPHGNEGGCGNDGVSLQRWCGPDSLDECVRSVRLRVSSLDDRERLLPVHLVREHFPPTKLRLS